MEKRRGRRDRGDQEEKRGNQEEKEQASQYSIPYVLATVWIPQTCSWSYTEKRRGRKETGDQEEQRGDQKGSEQASH